MDESVETGHLEFHIFFAGSFAACSFVARLFVLMEIVLKPMLSVESFYGVYIIVQCCVLCLGEHCVAKTVLDGNVNMDLHSRYFKLQSLDCRDRNLDTEL